MDYNYKWSLQGESPWTYLDAVDKALSGECSWEVSANLQLPAPFYAGHGTGGSLDGTNIVTAP